MNVLELEPLKSEGGDCFDDVVVTLDNWFGRGYELMYADSLRFEFQEGDASQTIGARMVTRFHTHLDLLQNYHGYRIEVHSEISAERGLSIIREQLAKNCPVGLINDSFYNPWDIKYQNSHYYTHIMVVVGIDNETNDLLIVDPFFELKNIRLPYDHYEAGLVACMTIEAGEMTYNSKNKLLAHLRQQLVEQHEATMSGIRAMTEAFRSIRFEDEMAGYTIFAECPLFAKFSMLMHGRYNYPKTLEYLALNYDMPPLADIAEEFKALAAKWSTLRGLIMKMSYIPNAASEPKLMNNLTTRLQTIVELESDIVSRLIPLLGEDEQAAAAAAALGGNRVQEVEADLQVRHITPIDLRQLCDLRGVENSTDSADLDSDGYFFCREGAPDEPVLHVGDMSFAFPAVLDDRPDHFLCLSQSVELPQDSYRGLMILGCCDRGGYEDQATIEYADGTSEQVTIGFSDWWDGKTVKGQSIAWKAYLGRQATRKLEQRVHMFARKIPLSATGRTAVRIVMPMMPSIHLFGLSMWR
ncbi:hypothetical protein B5M42_017410 [Paenibacillus athensensis]|uniref:Butirosin biosynthesis protein H N-terminal domain-containing protein n=1 Tax=Paenibacillus athensensis TaxID=1967502 RepID=A0A4Y8PW93_9BACL|nr:BtrH N-terminal domain-containing protein [Paenibacillus athensensis]MCD1260583.1 hypothetical protein [Paenibacillus athensensis]